MAGTNTITYQRFESDPFRRIQRVTLDWLSDAAGAVNGTDTTHLAGELLKVVFIPDGGATAPTALYDITLEDENGLDILAGQGANLSETTASAICPGVALKDGTTTSVVPVVIDDLLELKVTNAGDSKGGTVVLYLR